MGDGDGRLRETCLKTYNPGSEAAFGPHPTELPAGTGPGHERDDDRRPNACDPDDDGDGVPDFGTYHSRRPDRGWVNRSTGNVSFDRLYVDPGGNHDSLSGYPPREDNCPYTPNPDQENSDLEGPFRDGSGRPPEGFRGDACDADVDDDGVDERPPDRRYPYVPMCDPDRTPDWRDAPPRDRIATTEGCYPTTPSGERYRMADGRVRPTVSIRVDVYDVTDGE